jgi:hypothetical protein
MNDIIDIIVLDNMTKVGEIVSDNRGLRRPINTLLELTRLGKKRFYAEYLGERWIGDIFQGLACRAKGFVTKEEVKKKINA